MFNKNFFPYSVFLPEEAEWKYSSSSSLTIYEDKTHVVIEAAVPGIPAENIHLSHHHGYIIIEGEKEEEEQEKERKYHMKASQSFAYRIPIPQHANDTEEPDASVKNGIMVIKFHKSEKRGKKIPVKKGK